MVKKINWNSEKEVWIEVARALKRANLDVLLVGGSVVSVYTEGVYQSGDIDLVPTKLISIPYDQIENELNRIGYNKIKGQRQFHRDGSRVFVEFVSPPPGIGDDYNIKPDKLVVGDESFFILSPTDCVRDRLASFIHWKNRDALDQAALVALKQKISYSKVKKFCIDEGAEYAYTEFMDLVKSIKEK